MNKPTKTLLGVLLLALMTPSLASALDLSKTKAKGDLRLRYQTEEIDQTDSKERTRFRYRYRLQLEQEVNDKTDVIFGLASGSTGAGTARSTNENFDGNSSTKGLGIDLAYIKYRPSAGWKLQAGKMKNPLWRPSDMLWDTDINPEGFSVKKDLNTGGDFLASILVGHFVLEEREAATGTSAQNDDTTVTVIQPKAEVAITDTVEVAGALSYYSFSNVKGQDRLAGSSESNSIDGLEQASQEFAPVVLSSTLTFSDTPAVEMIQFFAEYVQNGDAESVDTPLPGTAESENNKGYIFGVKFGDKRIKTGGNWQVKVSYRDLENDAWLDSLSDSDAYNGATGIKGLEAAIKFGLAKNVSLGIDYYSMEQREEIAATSADQQVVQLDLNFKF